MHLKFSFSACLNAHFYSSLSSVLLSDASSYELLCPNIQSAPSMLVQWAASQQHRGTSHFPVPPGPGILK